MLSPRLIRRIRNEVPSTDGFYLTTTETEFRNAAKYLKDQLNATDDDVIAMLRGLYVAMSEEYQD